MTQSERRRPQLLTSLIVYAVILAIVMAAFHILIAMRSGIVSQWALIALIVAAAVIIAGSLVLRKVLRTRPFAFFIFHAVSYALVVGSIAVHAFLTDWAGAPGGGLIWMVGLWSIGLLVHAFASIAEGGFADADA